ncbi:hypothetical protein CBR_g51980 [Chara braunii]|uniref:leucine--tRNA ligase n=1 Tax=Chara braunii TaxID=69332 RepID=A0A388K6J9_CHABU|nr:hypothetical protein CBR_g51980 [Chara braunii]|eukprot:GBG65680.1 hypothetical protein CBR_g51980 [Chara braunii]
MAVPAHDERDYEFAVRFGLPIRKVVARSPSDNGRESEGGTDDDAVYAGDGVLVNSVSPSTGLNFNGMPNREASRKISDWLETTGQGRKKINYKLRDWLFARQRYWGEPFPIIFIDGSNEASAISEDQLPLILPEVDSFTPTGTGEPPLAKAQSWVRTVDPVSGKPAIRETNTMPQWAGSCWYYLRFMDPTNSKALVDPAKERYWGPVDLYVGGAEHSVLHLLYARFWHKVEFTRFRANDGTPVSADIAAKEGGYMSETVSAEEVVKVGNEYVLQSDPSIRVSARAHKMSKSRGNVINPDDVIQEFGADSLRLYEMFMGPLRDTKVWSTKGVEGVHRFLARSWRLVAGLQKAGEEGSTAAAEAPEREPSIDQLRTLHQCIKKVTDEIEGLRFNTAIAAMMEFVNSATKWEDRPKEVLEKFVLLLSPFAPHIAEELWSRLGNAKTLAYEPWPQAEDRYLQQDFIKIAVQVNGKVRSTIELVVGADEAAAVEAAMADAFIQKAVNGKSIAKKIFVPGRILNLVVR